MTPLTIVTGPLGPRLRDLLHERGLPCILVVAPPGSDGTLVSACAALASAGISTVVQADPGGVAAVAADLQQRLPRVAVADDLSQVDQWAPAEAYTPDELAAVTARLQAMGYA